MTIEIHKANYSRRKARKIVKQTCPDLRRDEVVHHMDLDPFNNNIGNLSIILAGDHTKLHYALKPWEIPVSPGVPEKPLSYFLKKLESEIELFNACAW